MSNVKVSVIVPIYNSEKYLEKCLDSLVFQTFKDIEIICVNDGSLDNSKNIIERYSKKDERIVIINKENGGISSARNAGIKVAKGEYIGFLDSDDFLDLDYFEKLYNSALEFRADIVCSSMVRENEKMKKIIIEYNAKKSTTSMKEKLLLAGIPEDNYANNKIYKRELVLNNTFKEGVLYEDVLFSSSIIEKSDILACAPDVYYHYWKHSNSLIKDDSDKARFDKYEANIYLNSICQKYKIPTRKNYLYREDVFFLGIKILRKVHYKMTDKYYLFGFLPILKKVKRV